MAKLGTKMRYKPITINREPARRQAKQLAAVHEELAYRADWNYTVAVSGLGVIVILITLSIWWVSNL